MKRKGNRGVTLVELVIVLALLSVVIAPAYLLLGLGNRVHGSSIDEYELQSTARLAAAHINRIGRFATATFTIPKSSFRADNLTTGWNYIGVMDGAVVSYEYAERNGVLGHHRTELLPASDHITYEIVFKKMAEDHQEKIIGFSINGYLNGRAIKRDEHGQPIGHISINSQVEALNSLQVIHKGTALNPAVALAFRTDSRDRPDIETILPVARIAMVLDVSGSMNDKMDGTTTNRESDKRITKLKNSANKLLDQFAASDHPAYLSLVPFSTSANGPKPFYSAQSPSGLSTLRSLIGGLRPDGGTNTGDGIRRAYYQVIDDRSGAQYVGRVVSDYIIILVDGETTFASVVSSSVRQYVTGRGDVNEGYLDRGSENSSRGQIAGNGYERSTFCDGYVDRIGAMVRGDGNIQVYVIGFSSKSSDFGSLANIASATAAQSTSSGKAYFEAGDEEELDLAFGEIQKRILNDLWHIDGPNL